MNVRYLAFAAITVLGVPCSVAQDTQDDPIKDAIREFGQHRAGKTNEVTVILDPAGEPPAPIPDEVKPEPAAETPNAEPAAVSDVDSEEECEPPNKPQEAPPEPPPAITEEPAPKPRQGLAVRVEKLQTGTGNIDPSQVKLLAPFPAKPLAQAPAGWRLEASENAPPITREVELSPGNKITLTVRPHLLVPDTDGTTVFNVSEPGFDASLGYRQNTTVGAILANTVRQLEDDSKELGSAIDKLQQLLVSLPKPEPQAVTQAAPPTEPKPELKPKIKSSLKPKSAPKAKPVATTPKAKPETTPNTPKP